MVEAATTRPPIRPRMNTQDLRDLAAMLDRLVARPDPDLLSMMADDLNSYWGAVSKLSGRAHLDGHDLRNIFYRWLTLARAGEPRISPDVSLRPNRLATMLSEQQEQDEARGNRRHPALEPQPE